MSGDNQNQVTRLATYGSLAPGQVNHQQLSSLTGRWQKGRVYGRLSDAGWGSALGFPGLVLDPRGTAIDVSVFDSQELADHWSRLDEFEGDGYRRVMTDVQTDEGFLAAYIYVLATADRQ